MGWNHILKFKNPDFELGTAYIEKQKESENT